MMTLLLLSSSKFILNDLKPYLGKSLSELRVAHIINASKGKGVTDLSYLQRTRKILQQQAAYTEDIDLDNYQADSLRDMLKNFDAVFVNGGSTFYLLKSIRESGFDKVIKELLEQGMIYIGASAGSYVTCPTIEMATWKHQDKYDHYGMTDFTAMNFAPFLLTVHYNPDLKDLLKEKISQAKYPTRVLTDDQAILIRDDKIELLGESAIHI